MINAYMMLCRLKMDLDYFFNWGMHSPKHLFYGNIIDHMLETEKLYHSIDQNIEWFTLDQLNEYKRLTEVYTNESNNQHKN